MGGDGLMDVDGRRQEAKALWRWTASPCNGSIPWCHGLRWAMLSYSAYSASRCAGIQHADRFDDCPPLLGFVSIKALALCWAVVWKSQWSHYVQIVAFSFQICVFPSLICICPNLWNQPSLFSWIICISHQTLTSLVHRPPVPSSSS
jgi:hypothetical protein